MPPDRLSRRTFMAAAGAALVAIGLPGRFRTLDAAEERSVAAALRPDGRPRLPPGQRAVKALRDMGGTPGPGPNADWELTVTGEVVRRAVFALPDLDRLPWRALVCDVHCVTGWTLLDAQWRGIRLSDLMAETGPTSKAAFVIFEAPGGYSANIPMAEAIKDNVMLADRFCGRSLTVAHGAPWRMVVPDRYFYKSVKWVHTIRFAAVDEPGYWESNGFSNSADPWKEDRYAP
jgi:DMSO/TMAO reductase YedYZ molybdopterin-dependent catalytic subunit